VSPASSVALPKRVLIDTDPGVDDALALLYAMARHGRELDIQAITVVCGNVPVDVATRNAKFVRTLGGWNNLPIHSGAAEPLARPLELAVVHGSDGLGGLNLPDAPSLYGDARLAIANATASQGRGLHLIAIGPLTNLAKALQSDPNALTEVESVVILGGAFDAPGNKNRVAEFNFWVDPEAASIVLRATGKKLLIPLDICFQAVFDVTEFKRIKNQQLLSILQPMLESYAKANQEEDGIAGVIMYDPLAVYCLMHPDRIRTEPRDVVIETAGTLTRGMSIDERRPGAPKLPNCEVVTEVDIEHFRNDFFDALNRL
jgi:inosine-uridine nucleoside N-ribohydrolase